MPAARHLASALVPRCNDNSPVMLMGVSSSGDNGDDVMEYVTPGEWIGQVVVERLE